MELTSTSSLEWDIRMVSALESTFGVVKCEKVIDHLAVFAEVGDDPQPVHQHGLVVGGEDQVADRGQEVQLQLAQFKVVREKVAALEVKEVAQKPKQRVKKRLVTAPRFAERFH